MALGCYWHRRMIQDLEKIWIWRKVNFRDWPRHPIVFDLPTITLSTASTFPIVSPLSTVLTSMFYLYIRVVPLFSSLGHPSGLGCIPWGFVCYTGFHPLVSLSDVCEWCISSLFAFTNHVQCFLFTGFHNVDHGLCHANAAIIVNKYSKSKATFNTHTFISPYPLLYVSHSYIAAS